MMSLGGNEMTFKELKKEVSRITGIEQVGLNIVGFKREVFNANTDELLAIYNSKTGKLTIY